MDAAAREERIQVIPGYDYRDEPNKGAHGMEIRFALVASDWAISWSVNTGWMSRPLVGGMVPGAKQERRDKPGIDARLWDYSPSAGAVDIHYRTQREDWQYESQFECDLLGGKCFGDTGYMVGDRVLAAMFEGGHAGVFAELEAIAQAWMTPSPEATT